VVYIINMNEEAGEIKKGKKGKGEHFKQLVVKTAIIQFILDYNKDEKILKPVPESEIIKELKQRFGLKDRKNLKNHLSGLHSKNFLCIEQIKTGTEDLWDITKIESVKNIHANFKEIRLNEYDKSLDIVFRRYSTCYLPLENVSLRFQLGHFPSFFYKCLRLILTNCMRKLS
jgi:hypothetical protein